MPDPQPHPRERGHARTPVAGLHGADVHVVGVGDLGHRRLDPLVHLSLERADRGDQRERGVDGVDRAIGRLRVRGATADRDVEPKDPDPGHEQLQVGGLGQEDGIGEDPGARGRERPVAGALLLDRRQDRERPGDRVGCDRLDGLERQCGHREPALHVPCAPAVQAAPPHPRGERRGRPQRGLPGRHDVDVPVDQERGSLGRTEAPDHVLAALVRTLRDAGERIVGDRLGDRQTLDREPEPLELGRNEGLGLVFASDGARRGDQPFQEGERGVGSRLDRPIQGPKGGVRGASAQRSHPWSNKPRTIHPGPGGTRIDLLLMVRVQAVEMATDQGVELGRVCESLRAG